MFNGICRLSYFKIQHSPFSQSSALYQALHGTYRDDLKYTQRNTLCKGYQHLWILVPMAEGRTMVVEGCQAI